MKMAKRILSLILVMNLVLMSPFVCVAGEKQDISQVFPAYTLTPADIKKFEKQMRICERMMQSDTGTVLLEAAVNHLDTLVSDIQTQSLVAEVLYYYDMEEETLENNYLYATEVFGEVSNTYISFLQEIYNCEEPKYSELFEDWTEVQLKYLIAGTEDTTALEVRNAEIMTEAFALDDDAFEKQIGNLYGEFVANGNKIAQLSGYRNYYEYASELVYLRDYGIEDREKFRQYVAEYIVPIYESSYQWYEDAYDNLDREGKRLFRDWRYDDYDSLEENYLDEYFVSLGLEGDDGMQHMFINDNYVTTDEREAYAGAFTVSVYEEPFCYFGPDYQNIFTVVHEIGHYYADLCSETDWISYDLCETHSQGNEMLFLTYLEKQLPEDVYLALMYYQMYYMAETIVQATLVDDFEERIYNVADIENYTTTDFDRVVRDVLADYGIDESDAYMQECVEWLWRNVGISSPVYYLSYAVSAMAALNLYSYSLEDYDAAVESYRKIHEEIEEDKSFTATLENAGIPDVFEEDAYIKLKNIFK